MAWDEISPYEPRRQDARIGILAANLMAALNKGTTYRPRDFSPVEVEPEPAQSEAELRSILGPVFGRIGKLLGGGGGSNGGSGKTAVDNGNAGAKGGL